MTLLTMPISASANRTVSGTVTLRSDDTGLSEARVRIWDYDRTSGDDLMQTTTTDSNGYYTMRYGCTKGQWDTKYFGSTSWRPDIYFTVAIRRDNAWLRIRNTKASRRSNHKCRDDIVDHIKVTIPERPAPQHCDHVHQEQISCHYNTWHQLYAFCKATASDGHVYEWKDWWVSGPAENAEVQQIRCKD